MNKLQKPISLCVIWATLFCSLTLRAESVDDQFTEISPSFKVGTGEFVHGQSYGKLLMRILILGAVPQQGIHYMPEGTDLMFGIIYAGGKADYTKMSSITIRRRGQKELLDIDLENLITDGKSIPKLVDGDIVDVGYNWRKGAQDIIFWTGLFTTLTGVLFATIEIAQLIKPQNSH